MSQDDLLDGEKLPGVDGPVILDGSGAEARDRGNFLKQWHGEIGRVKGIIAGNGGGWHASAVARENATDRPPGAKELEGNGK